MDPRPHYTACCLDRFGGSLPPMHLVKGEGGVGSGGVGGTEGGNRGNGGSGGSGEGGEVGEGVGGM